MRDFKNMRDSARLKAFDLSHEFAYRFTMEASIMQTTTISPKFQVVIPKEIRKRMGLKAGTKVQVLQ